MGSDRKERRTGNILDLHNVKYEYFRRDEEGNVEGITAALDDVSFSVRPGEFIAILGANGSGKSTLAKHLNAIFFPEEGTVWVDGMDTSEPENTLKIRQTAGMVFQNPDNQIIGQVVEEDVGFGPENLGVSTPDIRKRVEESLKVLGMYGFRFHSPNKLSGGQKQRVSIASVIAMHPRCIILDEPTAMLDPEGRKEVIRAARALNDVEEITVILITHYMEEVIYANRVFVMNKGKLVAQGTPAEIFSEVEKLKKWRLRVPQAVELAWRLRKHGIYLSEGILERKGLSEALIRAYNSGMHGNITFPAEEERRSNRNTAGHLFDIRESSEGKGEALGEDTSSEGASRKGRRSGKAKYKLIADHLVYSYADQGKRTTKAVDDVSFALRPGEVVALIGHTGSGKSTLIQHLNALLKPQSGTVYFDGADIFEKDYDRKYLRSKVGLVFQYPEHQLFEETVYSEVMYGPMNFFRDKKKAEMAAYAAIKRVGLPDECFDQSPFDLSGGQKRRVAIAGVLASQPEVLILDEPTAGLDPAGREELLSMILSLREEENLTVVLVSHSMEDVAEYADRIMVMDGGRMILDDVPERVFDHREKLESVGLALPEMRYLCEDLYQKGLPVSPGTIRMSEAEEQILRAFAGEV